VARSMLGMCFATKSTLPLFRVPRLRLATSTLLFKTS
jgi:hypothetical protein